MKRVLLMPVLVLLVSCASNGEEAVTKAARRHARPMDSTHLSDSLTHYLTSVIFERSGDYDRALEALRAAADLAPDMLDLQVRLLASYYRNEDYDNAAVMARRAIENDPDNMVWHVWLGRALYETGQFDEASETFEKAIKLDPESTVGYQALAEMEEQTNDLVGAVRVYERLTEIKPDSPFLHYRLGRNLAEMEDNERAIAALERALELDARIDSASYLLAALYLEADRFDDAIAQYRRFLSTNPRHATALVNMAACYARKGDLSRAIEIISRIIDEGRPEPQHYVERQFLWLMDGSVGDPSLAAGPTGAPMVGTLLHALIRKHAGEPHEVLLQSLDKIEGDLDSECNIYLNDNFSLFGTDVAGGYLAKELEALVREGIRSKVVDTILARTLMALDRFEDAEAVLLKVLSTYGHNKWIHYYLAIVYDELDRAEATEQHLRAYLDMDPNDPDVMNFLGYFFAEEGVKLAEAQKLLERALKLDPDNGFYLDSLGWIYYKRGDGNMATDLIRRAIRAMRSDDAVLRDHLGDAYFLKGEVDKALGEWRRAIRLDPDLEGVKEKIDRHSIEAGE